MSAPVPDFLFELEYSDQMNARFERTREGRDVFYAFHGSRLENFHSIIHNGLHCHLNKVSVPKPYLKNCFFTDHEEQGKFKRMLKGWSVNQSDTLCLHGHFSLQNSVFGEGTYLTSDLSMAVLYSPHSSGWRESILGPLLSCVALCEVIDHPDVKCQVKKKGMFNSQVKAVCLQHGFQSYEEATKKWQFMKTPELSTISNKTYGVKRSKMCAFVHI